MIRMGHLLHEKAIEEFENSGVIHLHCIAHILNLGVNAGMQKIEVEVRKAHAFFSKLRNSPLLLDDMKKIANSLEVNLKMPKSNISTY